MRSIGGSIVIAMVCVFGSEVLSGLPALLGKYSVAEVRSRAGPGGVVGVVGELIAPDTLSVMGFGSYCPFLTF